MAFPAKFRVIISTVLVLILVPLASSLDNTDHYCPPSSCGNIPNISYPFRLKGDSPNCGDQGYELSCDDNNHTLLFLNGSKYYVSQINYNNYTFRIVDSGIQEDNYSFIPRYFLNNQNFSMLRLSGWDQYLEYGSIDSLRLRTVSKVVAIVNCEKPVTWASSLIHWDTTSTKCSNINNGSVPSSNSSFSQYSKRYLYLIVGYGANVMDVEESCTIEQISLTSWPRQFSADPNISCTDIRNVFSYGFELLWYGIYCGSCGIYDECYLDDHNQFSCDRWDQNYIPIFLLEYQVYTAVSYNRLFWLIAYCFGVSGEVAYYTGLFKPISKNYLYLSDLFVFFHLLTHHYI
ncbi:uncharacterized protein LOC109021247 [Juglans regia]|uniref:Uncharacterized protein LOC109021247 n=1 Tax=Juglans regia TaxID=51240 RepID=A0A2I4HTB8_JUGRE|nr:uncharacterized protein LOC109021247 [Juglans regia]